MILVCGEALIDLFVDAREPAGGGLPALAVPGGSPFNLAVGIARLGAPSGFLGGLSGDAFGRLLSGRLAAEGVDLRFAKASRRPSPLAVATTGADGQPDYTFHTENCAAGDLTEADLPVDFGAVRALALGSFSLALEPAGTALAALAERATPGCVVSLDPNLRTDLVPDMARWRARFDGLVRRAAIVKASAEDIAAAYGPGADEGRLAAGWLAAGVRLVVTTDGPRGAVAYHASGRVAVPARAGPVVDTVGAGDSFHAALLAGLERGDRLTRAGLDALNPGDLRALLGEAATAAAITCSRRGADLPTRDELRAALRAA